MGGMAQETIFGPPQPIKALYSQTGLFSRHSTLPGYTECLTGITNFKRVGSRLWWIAACGSHTYGLVEVTRSSLEGQL